MNQYWDKECALFLCCLFGRVWKHGALWEKTSFIVKLFHLGKVEGIILHRSMLVGNWSCFLFVFFWEIEFTARDCSSNGSVVSSPWYPGQRQWRTPVPGGDPKQDNWMQTTTWGATQAFWALRVAYSYLSAHDQWANAVKRFSLSNAFHVKRSSENDEFGLVANFVIRSELACPLIWPLCLL